MKTINYTLHTILGRDTSEIRIKNENDNEPIVVVFRGTKHKAKTVYKLLTNGER